MTKLSWLMYLASTCGSLQSWVSVIAFTLLIGTILAFVFTGAVASDNRESYYEALKVTKAITLAKITFVAIMLSVLLPSERTMYFIVASEVSQDVLASSTGQKLINTINIKLDEYVAESTSTNAE